MSEQLQRAKEFYIGKGITPEATDYLVQQGIDVPRQIGRRLHRAQ